MHVLHIDTGREWRGGQGQVFELIKGLRSQPDFRQTLTAPPDSPLAKRCVQIGVQTLPLRSRAWWDFVSAARLSRWAARNDVALVHAHTAQAHNLGLWLKRWLPGVKLVVTRRVDFPVGRNPFSKWKYGSRVDLFIAISEAVARVLAEGGVARERIAVVHSGVDPARLAGSYDRAEARRALGIETNAPVVGTIGALVDHKDHITFVEAVAAIVEERPDVRFVIVGDGPRCAAVAAHIVRLGLEGAVVLAGWRRDVARCLAAFDVFLLSSHLEGLCTSLIDAMLAGVPIVATAVGGVPELVQDGKTGLLAPGRSPNELARAVLRLLDDRGLAQRLAQAARRYAAENFTAKHMVDETLNVYQEILHKG